VDFRTETELKIMNEIERRMQEEISYSESKTDGTVKNKLIWKNRR
jgi:hypothetical protein